MKSLHQGLISTKLSKQQACPLLNHYANISAQSLKMTEQTRFGEHEGVLTFGSLHGDKDTPTQLLQMTKTGLISKDPGAIKLDSCQSSLCGTGR